MKYLRKYKYILVFATIDENFHEKTCKIFICDGLGCISQPPNSANYQILKSVYSVNKWYTYYQDYVENYTLPAQQQKKKSRILYRLCILNDKQALFLRFVLVLQLYTAEYL